MIYVFQVVTTGCTQTYHSQKPLKVVNNTPATEVWQLLACQNCQTICRPYYWDKQHVNISPLILMTGWLMAMHCSQKTKFHFLNVFDSPTSFYQHKTIFLVYFWIVANTFKRYFWDVSETSQNSHIFYNMFETS